MDTQTTFKGLNGRDCFQFHMKVGDEELMRFILDRGLENINNFFELGDGLCDLSTYTKGPVHHQDVNDLQHWV